MTAQSWKTHWAGIDKSGDPQRYVGQMSAARNFVDDPAVSPFLEFCDLQVGERVLDVGSGTGWHVRAVSRIVGPTGRAVGVDNSESMLVEARKVAAARGVDVDFVQGSAYSLPFEANSFDCCLSVGMTIILDDPTHAMREMLRVTRPGGHICLIEEHGNGTFIGPAGNPLTRRLLEFVQEHEIAQPSGFEMVSILKSLGATNVQVKGVLDHMEDFPFVSQLYLEEWLTDAVAAGVLTAKESRRWLADQEAYANEGRFAFGMPVYLIRATKQ